VFEIPKTATGYAGTPTVLVSFCAKKNCTDRAQPQAGLIRDAAGNLFGTTAMGGTNNQGTVFEIAKTPNGYRSTPTVVFSFCAEPNCPDGADPTGSLVADDAGNLLGTTAMGGTNNDGTVFELSGGGFVPLIHLHFDGTAGAPNCHPVTVVGLVHTYGGLARAAAVGGYSSVPLLQNAITLYCVG
jgi:uncharacterized repeat protein (TIGR03803 family)